MHIWKELLRQAYIVATKSPDPSTQNGALIVYRDGYCGPCTILGQDCNRLPDGIEHSHELLYTPLKYLYVEHAEFGAIWDALRRNHSHLMDCTMVCPWAACTGCAKMLERSGIRRLVRHKQAHQQSAANTKWAEEIFHADIILRKCGVEVIEFDGKVGAPPILHGGKIWHP